MTADGGISIFLIESPNFKATFKLLCAKGKHAIGKNENLLKKVHKCFLRSLIKDCESSQSTKHETLFVRNLGLGAKTLT